MIFLFENMYKKPIYDPKSSQKVALSKENIDFSKPPFIQIKQLVLNISLLKHDFKQWSIDSRWNKMENICNVLDRVSQSIHKLSKY